MYFFEEIICVLKKMNLPFECTYSAKELAKIALSDKKRQRDTITLVVPHAIGDTRLMPVLITEIEEFIEKGLSQ